MSKWHWVALAFAPYLLGQTAPDIRVDVNLVRVPCIVMQAGGAPVHGLHRDEFVLEEDGVPQEVKYLWQELDLPLTVVLVVDDSCTQLRFVKEHGQTTTKFLERVLSPNDRAALVSVTDQARLVTDLTGSPETLRAGAGRLGIWKEGDMLGSPCSGTHSTFLGGPGQPCGSKALWNAVFFSARLGLQRQVGRKAMLLLTDGLDTGSDHGLEEAIAACQSANAVIYSIRYVDGRRTSIYAQSPAWVHWVDRGKPDLERIARDTGGLAFDSKKDDLAAIFDRIETDLRSQYVLGYTPSAAHGRRGYRKIRIKVTRPGLTVRSQERYYMQ